MRMYFDAMKEADPDRYDEITIKKKYEKLEEGICCKCGNDKADMEDINFFKMDYGITCHLCTVMLDPDGNRPNLKGNIQRCRECGWHYNTDFCERCRE